MAFQDLYLADDLSLGGIEMVNFYNVTMAVGSDAPNRRDDVMLVQYFLKKIYEHPNTTWPKPKGEMKVDGWIGETTMRWINQYQTTQQSVGNSIVVDNRVDRAKKAYASISKKMYTIVHLNMDYSQLYPEAFPNMKDEPDVPPELKAALGFTREHAPGFRL